jgi:hypothetical protein
VGAHRCLLDGGGDSYCDKLSIPPDTDRRREVSRYRPTKGSHW